MEERLKEIVFFISEKIGERNFWKYENLKKCSDYIKYFLSKNYKVNVLGYKIYEKEFENIYVIKKGKRESFIVLGSHYDTVIGSKGADDNASGVAINLLISEILKDENLNYGIIFSFFPNEEPPFFQTEIMGSYVFAKFLKKEKYKIEGMICFESVGYFSSKKNSQSYPLFLNFKYPDKGDFIGVVGNLKSKNLVKRIAEGIKKYSKINCEYLYASPFFVPGIDFSDNWSFYKNGFKACMITDTAFYRNPYYHTNLDTYEKLDYGKMKEILIGVSNFLKNI
ncbi:MAG: M28 family peptidase [candidate division WOR-3 bacterium]